MKFRIMMIFLLLLPLINFLFIKDMTIIHFDLDHFFNSFPEVCLADIDFVQEDIMGLELNAVKNIVAQYRLSLVNTDIDRLAELIYRKSTSHDISPKFIASVISVESSFNSYAVSHMNARGLMQITPNTAEYLNNRYKIVPGCSINLFDDNVNLEMGIVYIRELIGRYGSIKRAMAAYNFGPGRIDSFISRNISIPTKYYNDINNVLYTL